MKRLLKYLFRLLLGVFSLLLLYGLMAVVLSYFGTRPNAITCDQSEKIFISNNRIHLDIILAKAQLNQNLQGQFSDAKKYVAFGWGDKGFYLNTPTWDELKASTAIRAMLLKSETVMHVSYYGTTYQDWQEISICPKQMEQLQAFILASFQKDTAVKFIEIPNSGYGANDTFFEAEGYYSCLKTCNSWTNQALKAAEIKTAIWSPFTFGVLWHL